MAKNSTYNHKEIDQKWQLFWAENQSWRAQDFSPKKKFYGLIEFPYPSGEGLHVGHPRSYTAMDVICRKRRMQGYNVLLPIGFDAFGLPAENYAIKTGVHPKIKTEKNIAHYTRQLKSLGYSFDWDRAVNTTDPSYYRWTQWIFLQFFKHGLAFKTESPTNWCVSCQVTLANEEVVAGKCERCGNSVEQRNKKQWKLRITAYAEKLLKNLEQVDYLHVIKEQQKNWIGKSDGAFIDFSVKNFQEKIRVFTTRPDTLFGATYLVLSPNHSAVATIVSAEQREAVSEYQRMAIQRLKDQENKKDDGGKEENEKTGIFLGSYATHPITHEEIPVWIADYVLSDYGTGAIMAVPSHDQRDFEFAKKFRLSFKNVVQPLAETVDSERAWEGEGMATQSEFLNGLKTAQAKQIMTSWLEEHGLGRHGVQYHLHDWVFSRQRYWGEPMPVVFCEACQKRKQKVLLIHGFGAHGDSNWLPWVKHELEKHGFEVFTPTLTQSDHPQLEMWMKELMPLMNQLSEHDMIIGHSLGGKAALHLIERARKKIGFVFLVGTAISEVAERDWETFQKKAPDADIMALRKFWEEPLDWQTINALIESKNVIVSDDDPALIKKDRGSLAPDWFFQMWHGFGHFTQKEIPELLEQFLWVKNTGWIPLPEDHLPLELPNAPDYTPTATGESPLANIPTWLHTQCPRCGGSALRETDTMPQWAGSSWYFLRYCDPRNSRALADFSILRYWMPVDWYSGGPEHITLHLLYSRFWNEFLFDCGFLPHEEPYQKRVLHGLILGEGGVKMSKSKGNVVNPDDYVREFGADTFRLYILFMGPFDQAIPWDHKGAIGIKRFLEKVWRLQEKVSKQAAETREEEDLRWLHKTVKKVSEDIEAMRFNTAVSSLMILVNRLSGQEHVARETFSTLVLLLSPFAPHLSEELWERLGNTASLAEIAWPAWNEQLAADVMATVAIQVNGRVRDEITIPMDIMEEDLKMMVLARPKLQGWLEHHRVKEWFYVKGRIVNLALEK